MKVRFILLLLAFAFPLSSVGAYKAYPGPELPEDQVAIIKAKTPIMKDRMKGDAPLVVITVVDGQKLPKRFDSGKIAIKPGTHTVAVVLAVPRGGGFALYTTYIRIPAFKPISFEAEAGHTYLVGGKLRSSGPVIWIEDKKTKQVIAGTKPISDQVGLLHEAAAKGDLNQVKQLILRGAKVKAKDKEGNTPLHKAAIRGRTKVSALLIHEGAKVKAKNNAGDTPLHVAAYYGHTAVIELLITEGAKVNTRNRDGHRPLRLAADKDHKGIVELLKQHGAKE